MDALIFNSRQSNVAAAASVATDAAPTDGTDAGIDFSALLALELGACPQGDAASETQIKAETEATTANDAQAPLALLLLPQPGTDLVARAAVTPDAPATGTKATQPASAPQAAPTSPHLMTNGSAEHAAAVADQPANIAANPEKTTQPDTFATEIQSIEQRVDAASDSQKALEASRAIEAATVSHGAPGHAVHVQPLESRAPLSQPSALLEVQAPVSEPGFAQALSRQVVWMVDKDAQVAELRINPPELGPVEVRLTLTQDSASAEFVSPHAEVRAALEGAIARLRESLAEAGIQLGEASVSAESFSSRSDAHAQNRNAHAGNRDASFSHRDAFSSTIAPAPLMRGLVDVFA